MRVLTNGMSRLSLEYRVCTTFLERQEDIELDDDDPSLDSNVKRILAGHVFIVLGHTAATMQKYNASSRSNNAASIQHGGSRYPLNSVSQTEEPVRI
jgi:hypothetical protein